MQHRIILGTGNEDFDSLLQGDLEEARIGQVISKVSTRNVIVSRVMETSATMVFISDDLIGTRGTDEEWEQIIADIRRISVDIRIIFFCDRPQENYFLTKLTTYSIFDIFNEGTLPETYLEQLKNPPLYKNIDRFRVQERVQSATEEFVQKSKEQQAESIIKQGVKGKKTIEIQVPKENEPIIETVTKEVPVYIHEQVLVPSKIIAVASAFDGAGSSTVCRIVAEFMAMFGLKAGILESPYSPATWHDLMQSERYFGQEWVSWHAQLDSNNHVRQGSELIQDRVGYIFRKQNESFDNWDMINYAYLVGHARAYPVLLVDIGSGIADEREKVLLQQADHILLVTGYDTHRVNRERSKYNDFLVSPLAEKLIVVANKSTERLQKEFQHGLAQAYGVDHLSHIPNVPAIMEMWMGNESILLSDKFPQDKEILQPALEDLCSRIYSREVFGKVPQKETIWTKMKKKLK